MLHNIKKLTGHKLAAADGSIGKVKDFLFDEAEWTVRWMVADTGDWLPKRKVLISPVSLGLPSWETGIFPVKMTKQEIEDAPSISADEPVSRMYEKRFFDQYGWEYYWGGAGVWGGAVVPVSLLTRQNDHPDRDSTPPEEGEHVLRSTSEITGYHIHVLDGELGHVETLIMDDETWTLRYLVIDTRNWLPGRKVLVSPEWVASIRWVDRAVSVGLTRDMVKRSPEYKHDAPLSREYEKRLYEHYGHTPYWKA